MAGLAGPVAETDLETADFSYPNVSFRKYALDRDLTLLEQPYDGNQRSVQVQTELHQDVMDKAQIDTGEQGWQNTAVSTEITAKGRRL